jgi:hypothetical protein
MFDGLILSSELIIPESYKQKNKKRAGESKKFKLQF